MTRHAVNPRRQRTAKRPNPRRRPKFARRQPPPPNTLRGSCRVGELLVPVLGLARVQAIANEGGLLPYLARRLAARLAVLLGTA